MMYNQNLAFAIKSNGRILREIDGKVYLPFGSEYAIVIKNLHASNRASVKITIDGKDVLNGRSLIVNCGQSIDLERFVEELDSGYKFKFIERTAGIESHRGVGLEDGLVQVTYQFEEPQYPTLYRGLGRSFSAGSISGSMGDMGSYAAVNSVNAPSLNVYTNDAGVTAAGSDSTQKFHDAHLGRLNSTVHQMILHLKGESASTPVQAPVTVKSKSTCAMCGKSYPSGTKFCADDGARLTM